MAFDLTQSLEGTSNHHGMTNRCSILWKATAHGIATILSDFAPIQLTEILDVVELRACGTVARYWREEADLHEPPHGCGRDARERMLLRQGGPRLGCTAT